MISFVGTLPALQINVHCPQASTPQEQGVVVDAKTSKTTSPTRNPSHPHRRLPFLHAGGHVEPSECPFRCFRCPRRGLRGHRRPYLNQHQLSSSHARTSLNILDIVCFVPLHSLDVRPASFLEAEPMTLTGPHPERPRNPSALWQSLRFRVLTAHTV